MVFIAEALTQVAKMRKFPLVEDSHDASMLRAIMEYCSISQLMPQCDRDRSTLIEWTAVSTQTT